MNNLSEILESFILQADKGDLTTAQYPKEWGDLKMKTSFGMGSPARVPWIAFTSFEMQVSKGFYPVYLYYKDLKTLILAYGVSETNDYGESWPVDIMNSSQTVEAFLNKDVPRYKDSFVFKAYSVDVSEGFVKYSSFGGNKVITEKDLESDLDVILGYYRKIVLTETSSQSQVTINRNQGLFYMEKQLEDFIIHNWDKTELGKDFDLIVEEGVLLSQQYPTDIGPIDILAIDKKTKEYVVIELKRDQTSDATVGQLARYMGWIKVNKKVDRVKGVIIAGEYDRRLDYALRVVPDVDVFLYKVDFSLSEFKGVL